MESMDDQWFLSVIEGSKTKIWTRHPDRGLVKAREAYLGRAFAINRHQAEASGYPWLILSARYGFLRPDFLIWDYAESFDDPSSHPIDFVWLMAQANAIDLTGCRGVAIYGSPMHVSMVQSIFPQPRFVPIVSFAAMRSAEREQRVSQRRWR